MMIIRQVESYHFDSECVIYIENDYYGFMADHFNALSEEEIFVLYDISRGCIVHKTENQTWMMKCDLEKFIDIYEKYLLMSERELSSKEKDDLFIKSYGLRNPAPKKISNPMVW